VIHTFLLIGEDKKMPFIGSQIKFMRVEISN